jgi:hypothetical protein
LALILIEEIEMQEMTMDEVERVDGGMADIFIYLLFVGIGYAGAELGWWEFGY